MSLRTPRFRSGAVLALAAASLAGCGSTDDFGYDTEAHLAVGVSYGTGYYPGYGYGYYPGYWGPPPVVVAPPPGGRPPGGARPPEISTLPSGPSQGKPSLPPSRPSATPRPSTPMASRPAPRPMPRRR